LKISTFYQLLTLRRQGSEATCFRCGGIFSSHFTANLLLNVSVTKFKDQSAIVEDMHKSLCG